MVNLNKLHRHFLKGNIRDSGTGKTTAVMYQIIGFLDVMENTKFYVLTHPNHKRHIFTALNFHLHENNIDFEVNFMTIRCGTNTIIIDTYKNYMNTGFMYSAHEDQFLFWDFGDLTSVNTSIDSMEQIIYRNLGEVVGSVAKGVSDVFGGIKINMDIKL